MQPHSLLFLHIPKTGGTTLRNIIARQFSNDVIFSIGPIINEAIQQFRELPHSSRSRLRLLQGHMAFGLHTYLDPPAAYFTLLRNPIERAFSDYYYVKTNHHHPLHEQVAGMGMGDYLQSRLTGQLSNGQTRLLCGDCHQGELGIPGVRPLQTQDMHVAIENLHKHFITVGLQERFDETLVLLKRKLRWKLPLYTKANVAPAGSGVEALSESDRRLIAQHNELDTQLYEAAARMFDQQIAAQGVGFRSEVMCFRLMNQLYQSYHRVRYGLQPRIRYGVASLARRLGISV